MDTLKYRYSLEPYKSQKQKHACPSCGKRSYVRYIDEETREYLPEEFGKCDRADQCGYSLNPYKEGYHKQNAPQKNTAGAWASVRTVRKPNPRQEQARTIMYLPPELLRPALSPKHWPANNLFKYLDGKFGAEPARQAFEQYRVGTSSRWPGATVLPLFDEKGCVGGQVAQFDPVTGKTVRWSRGKESGRKTNWIHHCFTVEEYPEIALYKEKAEKYPILFGLHLALQTPGKTLCIVEAPKTAIVWSIVYPHFLWLAVGGLSWLNANRLRGVKNRNIVLVPDGGAGERDWEHKAADLRGKGFCIEVARLGLEDGNDVADVLNGSTEPKSKSKNSQAVPAPVSELPETLPPYVPASNDDQRKYNALLSIAIAKQFQPAWLGY